VIDVELVAPAVEGVVGLLELATVLDDDETRVPLADGGLQGDVIAVAASVGLPETSRSIDKPPLPCLLR
jgi:hypothetical protein